MPKSSRVHKMYDGMVKKGMPKGKAAAIAQNRTGQALSTGRKAKTHGGKPVKRKKGK
jgi:hypothetical protein